MTFGLTAVFGLLPTFSADSLAKRFWTIFNWLYEYGVEIDFSSDDERTMKPTFGIISYCKIIVFFSLLKKTSMKSSRTNVCIPNLGLMRFAVYGVAQLKIIIELLLAASMRTVRARILTQSGPDSSTRNSKLNAIVLTNQSASR